MPKLSIDGTEVQWDLAGLQDLSALMDLLYEKTASQGRVVCRVEIDGLEIDGASEKTLAGKMLSEIADVRVTTGTAGELYKSGIEGALTLADAMCADIGRSAGSFRQGDFQGGLSMYMACVTSMETFFQLSGAILGGFQSGSFVLPEGEGAPKPPSTDTAEIFSRLLEAQRAEDWILMADLLEYEVVPDLKGWKTFLEMLRGAQVK